MDDTVILTLTDQEAETILQMLGAQPTSTGVYPLAMKIKTQAEAHITARQKAKEDAEAKAAAKDKTKD